MPAVSHERDIKAECVETEVAAACYKHQWHDWIHIIIFCWCKDRKHLPQKLNEWKIAERHCLQVSQPAGQGNKRAAELFLRKSFVCQNEYPCTDQVSNRVSLTSDVLHTYWTEYLSEQTFSTSVTNLQKYIILDCVFIVCNVYISLQLFAHINKRFN